MSRARGNIVRMNGKGFYSNPKKVYMGELFSIQTAVAASGGFRNFFFFITNRFFPERMVLKRDGELLAK